MLVVLMGLFFISLVLDEYSVVRHAMQDNRIEACIELEAEDYEWDEGQIQNLTQFFTPHPAPLPRRRSFSLSGRQERGFVSDKQKLGLVRRYAPRKGMASYNYTLT